MILYTNPLDDAVRAWMLAHQTHDVVRAAAFISKVGAVSNLGWLAVAAAVVFVFRRRWGTAVSLVLAPLLAVGVYDAGKTLFSRARPPNLGLPGPTDSFPSAHSTMSAAVCCTLAYVCWREGILRMPTALTLALVPPLLIGMSRLYLNVHWATDVLAGWTAGLLVAVVCAAAGRRVPQSR